MLAKLSQAMKAIRDIEKVIDDAYEKAKLREATSLLQYLWCHPQWSPDENAACALHAVEATRHKQLQDIMQDVLILACCRHVDYRNKEALIMCCHHATGGTYHPQKLMNSRHQVFERYAQEDGAKPKLSGARRRGRPKKPKKRPAADEKGFWSD